ncbi:MAG: 3-dehydroquinate dehydratase [Thermoleophilia bacterium]|nr:3-dehydroquinate dehydratase [Thermoleophilia bacterium]
MNAKGGSAAGVEPTKLLVVLHGVNLNLLGERSPKHYGTLTLPELEESLRAEAARHGWACACHQTNHEGDFVELIHRYRRRATAMIVNPGAWTHYSYAIHDALELVDGPLAEVHLSAVEQRESWRRVSVVSDVADVRVWGKGETGYHQAFHLLIEAVERAQGEKA